MKIEFFIRQGEFQGLICSRNKLFSCGQNILSGTKGFLSGTKSFIWDKIDFAWDKKHFVRADGMGMKLQKVEKKNKILNLNKLMTNTTVF